MKFSKGCGKVLTDPRMVIDHSKRIATVSRRRPQVRIRGLNDMTPDEGSAVDSWNCSMCTFTALSRAPESSRPQTSP